MHTASTHKSFEKKRKFIRLAILGIGLLIALMAQSGCGPSTEELAAFQTVTALSAATVTPTPSPTPAGISPDQDLSSIISSAVNGDVINLAAGEFVLPQGFKLEKSLTLTGAGSGTTIITSALPLSDISAMVEVLAGGTLKLDNLSLEYKGSDPAAVIFLDGGSLELNDVYITGATVSQKGNQLGVIQMGSSSTAIIRDSVIAGSLNRLDPKNPEKIPGGILPGGTSHLTIEDSEIRDSYVGIYASGDAVITVSNTLFSNMAYAFSLLDNSNGTLTGSQFENNAKTQIALFDNSRITANENVLNNPFDSMGVLVYETANAHLEKNVINEGTNGILFTDNAIGEAVSNEISMAAGVGIYVSKSAVPLIDNNHLVSCEIGMTFEDDAAGIVTNNIVENSNVAVSIKSPARPALTGNFLQGMSAGLYVNPEDWTNNLQLTDNIITDGMPEVIVVTITPTK